MLQFHPLALKDIKLGIGYRLLVIKLLGYSLITETIYYRALKILCFQGFVF